MANTQGYAVPQSAFNPQPSMATFNPSIYRGQPTAGEILKNGSSSFGQILGGLLGTINPILGSVVSLGTGLINNIWQDSRATTAYNREREQWNLENAYNTPAAQVQRLREAGLNPLNYGLDGNSAYQMSAPQMASTAGISNPLVEGMQATLQDKQLEAVDAQIAKTKSETSATELNNQFMKDTMEVREESLRLQNSLTDAQIKQINDNRSKIAAEIKKIAAETENEFEKKVLMQAQQRLTSMQADEIAALLPYKKELMAAQSAAQRAAAALNTAQAAIQQGLLDKGIVDIMFEQQQQDLELKKKQVATEAERQRFTEAQRRMSEWREQVYKGNIFNPDDAGNMIDEEALKAFNGLFNVMSMITTAIGAPFTKLFGL